jgi:hypothetical protein
MPADILIRDERAIIEETCLEILCMSRERAKAEKMIPLAKELLGRLEHLKDMEGVRG